ncbi:hypothetical protein BTO30_16705 [Domibacillus antri]|uniref:Uncharacterized protein n=1 Tax=Domibacillus antri TaxID=1714264 RepID=A0A1Q8Q1B8_9BACI|nr:hypothetical protein [Domibacillus antri]OLN21117.1 hypothetical protein BTO30_16705 [Domibacillus antri]
MVKRTINFDFFRITQSDNSTDHVNNALEKQLQIVSEGKVENVKIGSFVARMKFLIKKPMNPQVAGGPFCWIGSIERVDITENTEGANLDGIRKVYADGEDEGPVKDTIFLYNPTNKVLVLHKSFGGLVWRNIGIYIRKLCKKRGIQLETIVDFSRFERTQKAPRIKNIEYRVALPENLEVLKNSSRTIVGDFLLARALKGKTMKVTIGSPNMDVNETIKKVVQIKELGKDNVKSLKVITENDGNEEALDLINEILRDSVTEDFTQGRKFTAPLVMDHIFAVYNKHNTLLNTMFINEEED